MITNNLYKEILINPVSNGNDELFIVSGYSSATFLRRHLNDIKIINPKVKLNLLIGMHHKRNDHSAYLNIKKLYPNSLMVIILEVPVHSKLTWIKMEFKIGFSGSANYSQYGFNTSNNQMVEDDPSIIEKYLIFF